MSASFIPLVVTVVWIRDSTASRSAHAPRTGWPGCWVVGMLGCSGWDGMCHGLPSSQAARKGCESRWLLLLLLLLCEIVKIAYPKREGLGCTVTFWLFSLRFLASCGKSTTNWEHPMGGHGPPMAELRFRLMYKLNCFCHCPFTWLKLYKLNLTECVVFFLSGKQHE